MKVKRNTGCDKLLIYQDGEERLVDSKDLLKTIGIDWFIRITKDDYQNLPNEGYFGHFNLQFTEHKIGYKYSLPKILRHGYYVDDEHEVLPLLDFSSCKIGECVDVKEQLSYNDLDSSYFQHSFKHIKDIESLKQNIFKRYFKSMPNLTQEEILELGVAFTLLKIIN